MKKVKISIESFTTADGGQTTQISPSATRRQKANWYIWVKPDGSGILVIGSGKQRIPLPSNIEKLTGERCEDSACPLLDLVPHIFGKGCRLYHVFDDE
jgi:hypothetical protein